MFKKMSHKVINAFLALLLVCSTMSFAFTPAVHAAPVSPFGLQKKSDNTIHLKFKDDSGIHLTGGFFVSDQGTDLASLNDLLDGSRIRNKDRLFADSEAGISSRRSKAKQRGTNVADLNAYFKIKLQPSVDLNKVVSALKTLPYVDQAYAQPIAAAPPSANYTGLQNYRTAAPEGIGIDAAAQVAGGQGQRVKLVDIEYGWNVNHEDLGKLRTAGVLIPNGTPYDPFYDDHGTAVLGEILADINTYGVSGLVPGVSVGLVNAYNQERGYDLGNSIYLAAANMQPGDVMMIEQQVWGPTGASDDLLPAEWVPEYYDAIKYATGLGIIVVETAGNGGRNLNDPLYGTTFPSNRPGSGAIMVGAGENCSNAAPKRSRAIWWNGQASNYGTRVDMQGPGSCVTTSGRGGLAGWTGTNDAYTNAFNGTSSAAPVVASAAAVISSSLEQAAKPVTPANVRSLLKSTGTPQDTTSVGAPSGNIGPLPNVAKALSTLFPPKPAPDTTPPTAPTSLRLTLNANNKVVVSWRASTDNVAVWYYQVYRNNTWVGSPTGLTFTDTGVTSRHTYSYTVRAVDTAGNVSPYTGTLYISTR